MIRGKRPLLKEGLVVASSGDVDSDGWMLALHDGDMVRKRKQASLRESRPNQRAITHLPSGDTSNSTEMTHMLGLALQVDAAGAFKGCWEELLEEGRLDKVNSKKLPREKITFAADNGTDATPEVSAFIDCSGLDGL